MQLRLESEIFAALVAALLRDHRFAWIAARKRCSTSSYDDQLICTA